MPVFLQVLALLAVILLVSFRRYFLKRGSKLAELREALALARGNTDTLRSSLREANEAHALLTTRARELAAKVVKAETLTKTTDEVAMGYRKELREAKESHSSRAAELLDKLRRTEELFTVASMQREEAGEELRRVRELLDAANTELRDVGSELANERDELRRQSALFDEASEKHHTELNRLTEERDLLVTAKNELETELVKARTYRDIVSMLHGRIVNFQDYTDGRYIPSRLKLVEMESKTARTITPKGARSRGAGVAPKARKVGRS